VGAPRLHRFLLVESKYQSRRIIDAPTPIRTGNELLADRLRIIIRAHEFDDFIVLKMRGQTI
jgi:hypothetical protein